jgi:DNA-3-methyladenine glycosylase
MGRRALEGWGSLLTRAFFEAPPELVAPRLLGKVLAHRAGGLVLAGRIVEAEAYLGPHHHPPDPAAHAHRGPTARNSILFGPPGHAYLYAIYGRYFCMNVSCEAEGWAGCVLLRALEPLGGAEDAEVARMARNRGLAPGGRSEGRLIRLLASGPGRLCQALGLTRRSHNGLDLADPASPLQIRDDCYEVSEALVTARIGIRQAADWPLRFLLPGNRCVSGAKNAIGKRVSIPVEFR